MLSNEMSYFFIADRVTGSLGKCAGVEYDIGFVLDVSGSIQEKDWEIEKNFVKDLVKEMGMSPTGGHAAVTLFSSKANLAIKFSDHTNFNSFKDAVDNLPKMGFMTRIDLGLEVALNQMFNIANGMRSNAIKRVLLITDGSNDDRWSIKDMKDEFSRNMHKIYQLL